MNPFKQENKLGLGLAALGRPGYINLGHAEDLANGIAKEVMEKRAHAVLDEAWKLGVRYFDVARSYGLAEKFLSSWLLKNKGLSRDIAVGSKWGYTYTANWQVHADKHEVKEHTIQVLRRQTRESKELLGTHLDLYHIHSATFESGVLSNKEVLEELARMKEEGLLIGLSLSGANQKTVLRRAMEIKVDGRRLFDGVQATYNIMETSIEEALLEAHESGMGVIVKEALANGRLTDRNMDQSFNLTRSVMIDLCHEKECTLDALALAFVEKQSFVDIVLSGASSIVQLLANSKVHGVEMSASDILKVRELSQSPELYWKTRSAMAWN